MKLPKYPLASGNKLMTFEFISEGQKGLIHKLVQFKQTNLKDVYLYIMKIVRELKKRKVPIVRIDKSLDKYDDIVLFPDKLEKANKMLRTAGLPKQWTNKQHHR